MLTPEQRSCKNAGHKLHAELETKGLGLTGVGVGEDVEGNPSIRIYLKDKKDLSQVPSFYEGYVVECVWIGQIVAH
jgi:hypothetical protein